MKTKFLLVFITTFIIFSLCACGKDPELSEFGKQIDEFCENIANIDQQINSINPLAEDAVDDLLSALDDLEKYFIQFGDLDFPEEFDYLEGIASEASDYMQTAVENYHNAYSNGSYNEYTAAYAQENYSRAYKRVKIIVTFLHGETPDGVDLQTDTEED